MFRSLGYRNYRLYFAGHGLSLVGTWMQMVAVGWLAYELTAGQPEGVRAFWLGVVAFASRIPTFVFAPLAGALVDRWDRRRLVLLAQILAMLQAGALAWLTLAQAITLEQLILLSLVLGLVNTLDVPARQSFMIEIVDRPADLGNAIALNSSMVNSARVLGPAIAGLLLKAVGAGFCFLLNAVSYVAVIASLLAMEVKPGERRAASGPILRNVADGLRYAFGFPPIRDLLLLISLVSLSGAAYTALLPVFAGEVLGGGAGLYGLLFAAAGVGALAAALLLAVRESPRGLPAWIAAAPAVLGAGLVGLGLSTSAWLSVLAMPVIGFGMVVQMAASNTVLQTLVEDRLRGRVMSLYSMAFMGMVPLGSLLSGMMARALGAPATIVLNGLACVAGALLFRRRLDSIQEQVAVSYARLGRPAEAGGGEALQPSNSAPRQ